MKPARFEYHVPATLDEAVALKHDLGADALALAGGQSLLPLLNMRLARPGHLIDLGRLTGLRTVETSDRGVEIGAMTRQRSIELDPRIREACPILSEAITYIAHAPIRNRGTVGGSIAHADAAGELPAVLALLHGHVGVSGPAGTRQIPAEELFVSHLTTSLAEGEIVTSVFFPALHGNVGWSFLEVSRRSGDFALVGVGALAGDTDALCFFGVDSTPVRVESATPADWQDAIDPVDDIHASESYRRELVDALGRRALDQARRQREVAP